MILITGASGKTGLSLIRCLSKNKISVRAFIRNPQYGQIVRDAGAEEIFVGNLEDKRDLINSLNHIENVYHICPNMHVAEYPIGKKIIAACEICGIEHFYYHSVLHPQAHKMPHHWQKLKVEEQLIQSKLVYTILQPSPYMQNMEGNRQEIRRGQFNVPYPIETKISLVDLDDVTEAVANIITERSHEYSTYELVGTVPTSQTEIACELTKQLGFKVFAQSISFDTWEFIVVNHSFSKYKKDFLIKMFSYYSNYGLFGNWTILTKILKREPTSLVEYIHKNKNIFVTEQS